MPVKKVKRRYISFQIKSEQKHHFKEVAETIQGGVFQLFGIHGLSQIDPLLLEFDEESQKGILRCSHLYLNNMRASIAFITRIKKSAAAIYVERVSGTIRTLRRKSSQ